MLFLQKVNVYGWFLLVLFFLACKVEDTDYTSEELVAIPDYLDFGYASEDVTSLEEDIVSLGRFLFFDPILSRDSTISCASCHEPEKAFTDGKAFSVGIDGQRTDRSAMSLANLLWRKHLMWDGAFEELEAQALQPIEATNEMDLPIAEALLRLSRGERYPMLFEKAFGTNEVTEGRLATAIAQFERTLVSTHSNYDRYLIGEYTPTEQELSGLQLFFTHPIPGEERGGNCGDCHGGFLTIDDSFHNTGLDEKISDSGRARVTGFSFDVGRFRTPSLRNIALTAPYMHDGRFATLEEVLDHYNEHVMLNSPGIDPLIVEASNEEGGESLLLTEQEKEDIIAFLQMLSDNDFINNTTHQNPF